jgi:hypothetical protein
MLLNYYSNEKSFTPKVEKIKLHVSRVIIFFSENNTAEEISYKA